MKPDEIRVKITADTSELRRTFEGIQHTIRHLGIMPRRRARFRYWITRRCDPQQAARLCRRCP